MNLLTSCIREDGEYGQLLEAVRAAFRNKPLPLLANGLCEGATEAFLVSLIEDVCTKAAPDGGVGRTGRKRCALIVCPEEKDCVRMSRTLERFGLRAAFYMPRDLSFYNITASHEYEHERMKVLSGLASGTLDAVLTTPDAALSYTIPPEVLQTVSVRLDFHTQVDLGEMTAKLVAAGYSRVDLVEGAGQFAVRGGIIDVYAPFGTYIDDEGELRTGSYPLRVELFGDEVDRMGLFDPETQRMTCAVDEAELLPSREVLTDAAGLERMAAAIAAQRKSAKSEEAKKALAEEAAAVEAARAEQTPTGSGLRFLDKYIRLIYPKTACLLDYFPEKTLFLIRSTSAVQDRLRGGEKLMNEQISSLCESGLLAGRYAEFSNPSTVFDRFLENNVTVHVDSLSYGMSGRRLGGIFGFRTRHMVSYADNFRLLCEDVNRYREGGYRIAVIVENEPAARSLSELFEAEGIPSAVPAEGSVERADLMPHGTVLILWRNFLFGYELMVPRIAILSANPDSRTGSLSSSPAALRSRKRAADEARRRNNRTILSFNDLEPGDLVVHETYGIGQFTGIENLTTGGVSRDYIGIRYAGTDKLYIPVEKLDMVSKYIGAHADDGMIKLSKLGSDNWMHTKARAKAVVKDMAKDLIRLYAERMRRPGHAFSPDDEFQQAFASSFEYEETDGQLAAIEDIRQDMQRPAPMDRLLCGDVGYGKTEVAMRAAFKCVADGYQVAVLVPTTILALQHFQTFSRRMRAFSVNVDMISRFRTAKEQAVTLRRLARGDVDIIIGTHRLLGKGVEFKKLGLLIVDEEQRFGVAQKEKLKQMAGNIDVLTLSATPIPRTLNMAMGGIRDISILDEAPVDRLPVQTYVMEQDDEILHEAIRRELRRGGQVFYLHNAVETIQETAASLAKALPDARITVAHGQMEKEELEEIWERMLTGDIDILVCTTIIETGVDVPNANTLIVDNADRMGLSQLHQLRGRVGRSSRRAYAYFTYRPGKALTDIAQKRLSAIREYAEFGAGFRIAMRDMEIRGTGDLLGARQHGHMESVGYELYIKLLNQAVLEERGEAAEEEPECTVSLQVSAFLPDSYVRYPAQRMALYRRIAMIRCREDMEDMADELIDRYGNLPPAAESLLRIAYLRALAVACGMKAVRQDGNSVFLVPEKLNLDIWTRVSDLLPGKLRINMAAQDVSVRLQIKPGEDVTAVVIRLLEQCRRMGMSRETAANAKKTVEEKDD